MRILLVNPPDCLVEMIGDGSKLLPRFEPLGILYIAAVLREKGHEVSVIDADAEKLNAQVMTTMILEKRPDIVGMTSFTANGGVLYDVGRILKKELPRTYIVFGNLHATLYAKEYISNGCCDAVIHGEGEYIFAELADKLQNGIRDFSDNKYISFRKESGEISVATEWAAVEDLSALPMPARDLVRKECYFIPKVNHALYGGTIGKHIFTSRGCPNRCTFCTVHSGKKQRFNSPTKVVDEIVYMMEHYGADYIFFMDSLFISNRNHIFGIFEEMDRRSVKISWGCEAHVRFINEETVRAMEQHGCHDMAFGIESGVQRLLDAVNKNTKIEQIENAVRTVKRYSKIKVSGLFILGLPGERKDETLQTIRFAKKLPLDMAQFSILTPYPGSQIFEDCRKRGELDDGVRPDGTIDTEVWKRYSAYISYTDNEPIWVTKELTAAELKQLQKRAVREFYLRPRQIWDQVKRIRVRELPSVIKTAIKTFF